MLHCCSWQFLNNVMVSFRDGEKESVSRKVLAEAIKWMERFDCLVVGPGLGRDPFLLVG